MGTWVFRGQHGRRGAGEEGTVWENLCLPLSSVVTQERCREMGQVSAGEEGVYPYQLDAIGLYVLEEDISRPLWVPAHVWVIWEIPGRKKCTLETVSNGVQALPSALVGVCACGVLRMYRPNTAHSGDLGSCHGWAVGMEADLSTSWETGVAPKS